MHKPPISRGSPSGDEDAYFNTDLAAAAQSGCKGVALLQLLGLLCYKRLLRREEALD